jgi:hypothetical protein
MDQHGLTRADMVPILATPSRVSEVLLGRKELSMGDIHIDVALLGRTGRPLARMFKWETLILTYMSETNLFVT